MLGRVIQPVQEPATLFLLREVQEDLDHLRPVAIEMTLEGVDVVVATTPKCVVRRLSGAIGVWERAGPESRRVRRARPRSRTD